MRGVEPEDGIKIELRRQVHASHSVDGLGGYGARISEMLVDVHGGSDEATN